MGRNEEPTARSVGSCPSFAASGGANREAECHTPAPKEGADTSL